MPVKFKLFYSLVEFMNKHLTYTKLIIITLTLLFTVNTSSFAETNRLLWNSSNSCNQVAGRPTLFDVSYNTDTKILRWIVEFERKDGVLPEGFQFALNGTGSNPKHHDGELAFFYYDATNFSDPKLTVYGYNGAFSSISWLDGSKAPGTQAPDKILSSVADNSFVLELIAESTGPDTIRLGFVIDSTKIQNHVPLYPGNVAAGEVWQGAQFTNVLGMWFHPLAGLTSSYGTDGYLTSWSRTLIGWCDTTNQQTFNEDPVCGGVMLDPGQEDADIPTIIALEGQPTSAMIFAYDYRGDALTVNYSGLPDGATVDPANGGDALFPIDCNDVPQQGGGGVISTICLPAHKANFEWTPQAGQAGTYPIIVTFTDPVGASVDCQFIARIRPNVPPVCDAGAAAGAYQNLSCQSKSTTAQLDATNSTDPDNTGPLTYEWTTDCPGASFDNNTSAVPNLTFNSETAAGLPVSCNAFLTVSDGFLSSSCEAAVSVAGCVKDCEGTINGNKQFDACGVCEGDGTSCLDCAGTAFGTLTTDSCGQCGGDNSTCCVATNQSEQLAILDGNAKKQEGLVISIADRLLKLKNTKKNKKFVEKIKEEANALQLSNWQISWSFPIEALSCDSTALGCFTTSQTSDLELYKSQANDLFKFVRKIVKRALRTKKGKVEAERKFLRKFLKRARKLLKKKVLKDTEKVIITQTTC